MSEPTDLRAQIEQLIAQWRRFAEVYRDDEDHDDDLASTTLDICANELEALLADHAAPVCDCGGKLTLCTDCAIAEWQAAHPNCIECCPIRGDHAAPVVAPSDRDIGLSIDMLDVDRLREWARLLLVHGADISHWASVPFVASKMQILATDIEKAVRDIGIMRKALSAAPVVCQKCRTTKASHCDLDEPGLDHIADCELMHHEFRAAPVVGETPIAVLDALPHGTDRRGGK